MSIERFELALAVEQASRASADAALTAMIDALRNELREEREERATRAAEVAALTNRLQALEASAGGRVDRLVGGLEAQGEHIGLLVQAVAMLLGEELGTPVASDSTADPERTDLDGNPY